MRNEVPKGKEELDERLQLMDHRIKADAEALYEKYRDQMDLLDQSLLSKAKGGLEPYDVYALGKQLESFDSYLVLCEEDGNLGQLGKIPQIAYDVITVAYGTSIIPFVASVQPIEEESGHVYFKQVKPAPFTNETFKGGYDASTVFIDPRTGVQTPRSYASNTVTDVATLVASGGSAQYYAVTTQYPVRPSTMSIVLGTNSGVYGNDFNGFVPTTGLGVILGAGVSGSVSYGGPATPGRVDLTFSSDPGAVTLLITYQVNYEQADDLPRITTYFDSTDIFAQVYALKGTIGMLQSYGMRKRFGLVAEDELAKDLVAEINAEIGGDLITLMYNAAMGNVKWFKTPPSNVSYYEHVQTLKYAIADTEANMIGHSQRGTITTIIAGRNLCAILSTLPGFNKLTDGNTLGAHVFGTLDGVMIIRVNEQAILDTNKAICIWKGTSPFEAPSVYSPFMPLVVTSTLPAGKNPIGQQRAAAVWSGVKILVHQFITLLVMDIGANTAPNGFDIITA